MGEEQPTEEQEEQMALTRKQLKALGIEDDKIDLIIEAHTETVDGLKKQIEDLTPAEKPEAKDGEGEPAKDSGAVNAEIEALKNQIAEMKQAAKDKEIKEQKTAAFKELLKECGIVGSEKRIAAILKCTDFDAIKLNKDGTIQNKDDLETGIKDDWADFIGTKETKGAETATPPAGEEQKDKSNQAFIDKIAQHRASLYGEQPTTEGG